MNSQNDDKQNYPFSTLKLNVENFGHQQFRKNIKSLETYLKTLRQPIRESGYKALGTGVIYSPMSPPSPLLHLQVTSWCLILKFAVLL